MFIRISLSTPRADNRSEVLDIEDALLSFFGAQPGFIDGYRLTSKEQVGRVTIWESESTANSAANKQHSLASRSRLLRLTGTDSVEWGLEGLAFKKAQ